MSADDTTALPDQPLYLTVADELDLLIAQGQLAAGERLPSVRELSQRRRLSATTALAALRALERRGVVEARPQSGYYVRQRPRRLPEPATSRPPAAAKPVTVSSIAARLLAASNDPDIIGFGAAIPEADWYPVATLQRHAAQAARRHSQMIGEYSPFFGLPALRHQIARRYAELGVAVDEDEVVITNGCMEALNLALRTVAAPGAVIAVESPTYYGLLQLIESQGMKALEIPTHARDGLSVDALAAALAGPEGAQIRACVVTPAFANPLGSLMPERARQALVRLCERHRVALIEDDIYGELDFAGQRPIPVRHWDRSGSVLLCGSFSKSLAPGARIGWLLAGRHRDAVRMRKFTTSAGTALIYQHALSDYLRTQAYARHLARLRRLCANNVARYADAVEQHFPAGTRVSRPAGGFVLWVELPRGTDTLALYERALFRRINFAPGPLFSASGRYRHCLRLNCGRQWTPEVAAALQALGRLVETG
ncbi:MAG: transcriptional regulator, GntR family/aminotransferase, class and family protein [Hydrocarboniphaga sp.]|uniref:aminotransferase-like domain-containing protein n=1 Tax=Hydrocarboniphaga sp. TaxID=2033016 RepID=UPI002626BC27|nr:PLP-dependent aminotransferase family protein [Hydrocarboniphaga sp.]MDB5973001.1 transcriptional regulator, GntR family/aminotransferase, class and family protein [Hydrocarboniphaga sp.]